MKMVTEVPDSLFNKTSALVQEGVFLSQDALVADAIERLVETQEYCLQERFVREDLDWALHGAD
jgi:hypothetical protein